MASSGSRTVKATPERDRPGSRRTGSVGQGPSSALARRRAAADNEDYRSKRASLLKHAADAFHEHGVADTTLAEIARRAGLDRATVYYYFANKGEVLAEILRGVLTDRAAEDQRIRALGLPADQALRLLIVSLMTSFDRHYPYLYYVQKDLEQLSLPRADEEWIVATSGRLASFWEEVVAQGVEEGLFRTELPIGIVAYTLIGSVAWSHRWYTPGHRIPPAKIGEGIADLLIGGLLSRPQRKVTPAARKPGPRA